jgi:hypothetical protein
MKKELQDTLFNKYPKIFRQRTLPMAETAMCWGIDTGDGWYKIIDLLCELLQWDIDNNNYPQIEAVQVKEKFGGLRFYTNWKNDQQSGMIKYAEQLSNYVCEDCGTMEGVTQTKGWIVTLCPKCMKAYKKKRELK